MHVNRFYWIGRLFSDYLEAYQKIERFEKKHQDGNLTYLDVKDDTAQPRKMYEKGGCFYRLKDMAHTAKKCGDLGDVESSLIWVIQIASSQTFHEMTRIRESLYETYKNAAEIPKLRDHVQDHDSSEDLSGIVSSLDILVEKDIRAHGQLDETFSNAKDLMDIPKDMFKSLLWRDRENHFIKRAIYVNIDSIRSVYGEEELGNMLSEFYGTDRTGFSELYRDSLLSKGFYDEVVSTDQSLTE